MKKVFLFILLFCAVSSIAQLPITQNLGSDSTLIRIGNNSKGALRGSLIPSTYTDTTQANAGRIDDYPFAIIATSGDGNVWQRNYLATGWVLIGGGSDPSGLFFKVGGNLFPVTVPSRNIGTLSPYGGAIGLMTNSVVRAIVPDAGFTLSNDTTSTKVFTYNPTSKEWGYANWNNGGGGSSGWSLTGNSGTNPSTNWLGTNDSTSWRLKVNGRNSGWIHRSGLHANGFTINYANSFTSYGTLAGNTLIERILSGLETGGRLNTLYGAGAGMYIGAQYDTTRAASDQNVIIGLGAGQFTQGTSFITGTGRNVFNGESVCWGCLTPGENTLSGAFAMELGHRPTKNTVTGSNALRTGNDASYMSVYGAYASHYTGCSISGVNITYSSSDWTVATVIISAPYYSGSPGVCWSQATGDAIISGGQIIGVNITNPGCGYVTITGTYYTGFTNYKPTVTITGDGTSVTAELVIQCGDNTTSMGHAAGWMVRAPKNQIYIGSGSEPSTAYFDQFGGAYGTGAGRHSSISALTKLSNAWAFGTNAKVGANRTVVFGAALPDSSLTFVLNKHIGDSTNGLNIYEGGAHIQGGLRAANITSNRINPEGANNIVFKKSFGTDNFSVRNTGGIVFKDHVYGLDKIDIGKDSIGYIQMNHRFGQGENNYRAIPLSIVVNMDSAHKKSRGDIFNITSSWGFKNATTNPSSMDGNGIQMRLDMAPGKGQYDIFSSQSFPTSGIMSRTLVRTESATDSVARINFTYAGTDPQNGYSAFQALTTFNHGKQADYYGHFNNFLSVATLNSQAGRYIQNMNHFVVGTNAKGASGRVGTVRGLYIQSQKHDSIDRAWGVLQIGINDYNAFNGKTLFGDTTQSASDSALTVKLGARFERGINAPNLPVSKQLQQLYIDASGNISRGDTAVGGSGTTLQDALTAGSTLTTNNTIDAGGNNFSLTNSSLIEIYSNEAENLNIGSANQSDISIGTNLSLRPHLGGLYIDTLNSFDDTTNWKPMVYRTSTGQVRKATYWPGSVGGGTPAGNFGNVQLNRNGAFATPGSDSLDFESATGLSVKGNINSTGQVKLSDGTFGSGGNPALTFTNDGTVGFALNGAGNLVYTNSNSALYQFNTAAMRIRNTVQLNWASGDPTSTGADIGLIRNAAGELRITNGSTGYGNVTALAATWTGRNKQAQGADVASANNLSLGADGNTFEITGTTQINLISNTNWQNGSEITLLFSGTPTVKNGQATSGSNITITLAGAADFAATANDVLKLQLVEIGGVAMWVETGRSVN